jgi:hypothetical protein
MAEKKKLSEVQKFHANRMRPLVGATIEQIVIDDSEGECLTGFMVKAKDGRIFQVIAMCDPEGNGPGWLTIDDINDEGGDE